MAAALAARGRRREAATYCVARQAPGCDEPRVVAARSTRPRASRAPTRSGSGRPPRRARSPTTAARPCGSSAPAAARPCSRGAWTSARTARRSRRSPSARATRRRSRCAARARTSPWRATCGCATARRCGPRPSPATVTAAGDVRDAQRRCRSASGRVESGTLTRAQPHRLGSGRGVATAAGASAALTDSIVLRLAFAGTVALTRSLVPRRRRSAARAGPRPARELAARRRRRPARRSAATEPQEDARGAVRAMDGNGDGTARRDIGAFERRPPAPPSTAGNLLANPSAEQGEAATDDRASPAPPRWTRTGAFTSVRYGTVSGAVRVPVARRGGHRARRPTRSSPPARAAARRSPGGRRRALGAGDRRPLGRAACGCRRCSAASAPARTTRSCPRAFLDAFGRSARQLRARHGDRGRARQRDDADAARCAAPPSRGSPARSP